MQKQKNNHWNQIIEKEKVTDIHFKPMALLHFWDLLENLHTKFVRTLWSPFAKVFHYSMQQLSSYGPGWGKVQVNVIIKTQKDFGIIGQIFCRDPVTKPSMVTNSLHYTSQYWRECFKIWFKAVWSTSKTMPA